ncbi:MAG: FAD-binding oxidoreductase [Pseudomonadota bacterium]
MKEIRGTLIEKIERAETIKSFRFKPEEKIVFLPGQFLQVIFDEKDKNNRILNKYLSFSCAPQNDYIEVTKRLSRSEFSERLRQLREGDTVLFKAPMGNCVFKDEYRKIGFLIGGIGITPVISIIEYIVKEQLDADVCLLYSNRLEHDIAFKSELDYWQRAYPHLLHVLYLVSDCEPADKRCMVGTINKDIVMGHMSDWQQRVIFVFGPPAMVSAMENICSEISCRKELVKTEKFIGY